MEDPQIKFTVKGKEYKVDFTDIDGREERLFRQTVGFAPTDALAASVTGGLGQLEVIAGFIWLLDRRDNPKLKFDDVLGGITYADLSEVTKAEEDDADPPASGGRSEIDSPPSNASTESDPGSLSDTPQENLTSSSVS